VVHALISKGCDAEQPLSVRGICFHAVDEIERLRAELLGNAEELARLRERVTMLVEAAVEDAERAARLERVITNKEPLL
jgi:hypothetical protein